MINLDLDIHRYNMEQEEKKISYEKLKTGARRVRWRHRHWNLP